VTAPDPVVWATVALVGLGTFLLRASFLFLFERVGGVPSRAETALGMVPAAVLSALVAPAVLAPDGAVVVAGNARLLAAVLAAAVAWYTEDVLATIVTGLIAVLAVGAV
jgi:branched-subunit amino acid transport protein